MAIYPSDILVHDPRSDRKISLVKVQDVLGVGDGLSEPQTSLASHLENPPLSSSSSARTNFGIFVGRSGP